MKIDFVKTLEASAPYIPGRIYFEESTSLIKVATASNQYRVFGGVRSADYDSSTDILTIQNGNGDEIYIDFSQYVKQDEYEDDQYVVSVALNELNSKIDALQTAYDNIPETLYNYTNHFFDYVEYNSTDKTIDFYNDDAGKLQSIDATAFIKDGMVNDVSIHNGTGVNADSSCLVITFNTDASTEAIEIPVTKIFDPSLIPTDASVAAWGYTKNALTGINFNGVDASVTNGVASILPIFDSEPTKDSSNFITSGAVYSTIADTEEVFASAINDIQTNLSSISQEMDTVYDEMYAQMYGTLKNFQINGVTQQTTGTNYDTVNFILDDVPTQDASYHGVSSAGLYNVITQNERVVAEVMNDLNDRLLAVEDIPVVDSSTVSNWGFTKNGLTGVSFNGVDASVTNGVASIIADVSGNVEIIDIVGVTPEDAEEETIAVTAGTFARCTAALDEGKTAILRFKPSANSHDALDYYVNTVNGGSNNSYQSIWFVDGNGYSSIGLFSNDTVEIVLNNFLKTETDPVFSASAAAGITSTDITNWNNKVSNVQADWNATTGLSAILNKPTIPSTLDQIADGSTRKLSNFVLGSRSNAQVHYNDIAQVNALYDLPNGILYALPNSDIIEDVPEMVNFILATTSDIPTDASVAGWGYIKSYTETDPTVPAWAKAANKPTYTAAEVGALPDTTTIPTQTTDASVAGWGYIKTIADASIAALGYTKNTGTLTGVKFNNTNATINGTVAEITATIPPEVTESTVSGWGFTKNAGTLTSHADHKLLIGSASATAASGNTITYVESLTGTATATHGDLTVTPTLKTITIPSAVTESTVSGWGFTKNTGTLTSHATHKLTATNNNATSTSGTITFVESLTGTNTATSGDLTITATRKSVTIPAAANNATITIQKGGTTVNSFTVNASSNKTINIPNELPAVTSTDNGKILEVVNGAWTAASPITVYSGSNAPNNSTGINGDIYIQS